MSTYHLDLVNGNDANSGADWANAWLTITTGAGAGDIAPGDTIKIAKTADPVSIGTCAWTDLSKTVTRTGSPPAGSETLLVDDCESGWTAANSATVTHPTAAMKAGSANVTVTKASYATATLYAYKALAGVTDFSGFDAITLWIRNDAAIADAARWSICLCSDTAGATPVDTFAVPAIPSTNRWACVRLERSGGGALGASIQSIAVYSGVSAPTNGQDLLLDNINACNDFSLCSMITKASTAGYSAESVYPLQSINGTTLLIDNETNTLPSAGRGYSGTTEEVTTYRREAFKTALASAAGTNVQTVQEGGTDGIPVTFSGGWNTSSDMQDGMTLFDGQNGNGVGLMVTAMSWVDVERVGFVRYGNAGISFTTAPKCSLDSAYAVGNATRGVQFTGSDGGTAADVVANNNGSISGLSGVANCRFSDCVATNNNANGYVSSAPSLLDGIVANNNGDNGIAASGQGSRLRNITARGNVTAGLTALNGARHVIDADAGIAATQFSFTAYADGQVRIKDYDGSGRPGIVTDGGIMDRIATDFDAPATGDMWRLLTDTDARRTSNYPLRLRLPGIAVVANKLVTIKAQMRKAHATNVVGKLVMPGGQIAGVAADVVATLASATTEEELTITFTPTAAGVVVPEVWAEYVAGHAAVCIDRLTSVTQAA